MIGWINISVESFVREKFGDAVWDQTLQASGVQAGWVSSCPYPDAATYSLVITASNILGVTPAQALESYGMYFVDYTSRLGYEKLLKSLGSNMAEFLKNLNDLHLHLSMSFPAMAAPAFKCTDVGPTCLTLHYHSHRPALGPIVVGVLKGLAEQYWGLGGGQLQVELLRGRGDGSDDHEVTVLFSDIVGFTEIASRSSPLEVCSLLDELYQRFDAAIEEHPQLYKVETIGDAYMVVCNVTVPCDDHADVLLEFALRMHEEASLVASSLGEPVRIRVGMHSGPVVAGVVGRKMPRFCLFGDTVNTASRMESHGEAGKIHISEACYSCLRAKERFLIRERGNITVKGKGTMRTYLIAPAPAPDPPGPTAASTHRFVARRASVAGTVPATPTVEVPLGYAAGDYSNEFSRASTSSCASCVTSVDGFSQFVLQPGGGPGSGRSSLRSPRAPQSPSNPLVALASSGTPFAAIAGGSVRDVSLRDDSAPLARLSDASGGGTSSSGAAAGAADEAGRGGELLGRRVSDMGAMSADSVVRRPVPRRRSQLSRVQELVAKEGEPEAADSTQE
ncbi:hypothetical protein HXX76_003860 [Chlamydomonas incerta]|uniref:guanylate cyclase n=1 Tax=Chlamydomonas incerta TaxID=51695 RepID=A0A835T8S4_CHLIN|nr:hypothetical protein HXX76_003860 [Chlamydomonas incerta]|eukprot:KAG2441007.1 hypothetical protein HXX76_003860 [Chlamydomonas incerta]